MVVGLSPSARSGDKNHIDCGLTEPNSPHIWAVNTKLLTTVPSARSVTSQSSIGLYGREEVARLATNMANPQTSVQQTPECSAVSQCNVILWYYFWAAEFRHGSAIHVSYFHGNKSELGWCLPLSCFQLTLCFIQMPVIYLLRISRIARELHLDLCGLMWRGSRIYLPYSPSASVAPLLLNSCKCI